MISGGTGELELSVAMETIHDLKDGRASIWDKDLYAGTIMANGWRAFGPLYAGGGLGIAGLHGLGDTTYTPAGQAGGDLVFGLTSRLSLDLRYVYVYELPVDLDGARAEYDSHRLMVGVKLRF